MPPMSEIKPGPPPLPDRQRPPAQPARRRRQNYPPPPQPQLKRPTVSSPPTAFPSASASTSATASATAAATWTQSHGFDQSPIMSTVPEEEDLSPLSWDTSFDEFRDISLPHRDEGIWRVYSAGFSLTASKPPLLVLVLLHGAGHCALSWGAVATRLKQNIAVIAYDARGHGATTHTMGRRTEDNNSNEMDMESVIEKESKVKDMQLDEITQVQDAKALLISFFENIWPNSPAPSLVICGHSMGGAIAIRLATSLSQSSSSHATDRSSKSSNQSQLSVSGLVVVDVVEGTAMAALPHMASWLSERTQSFSSIERAIRYVTRSGFVRNIQSARLSVPPQLTFSSLSRRWHWRTALEKTDKYWSGWFKGLSPLFLSVPVAKLLVLANVNRLDKDLMIAQMQGKFQNILITSAGHAIHEDQPEQTANSILDYLHRNMLINGDFDAETHTIVQQRRPIPPLC